MCWWHCAAHGQDGQRTGTLQQPQERRPQVGMGSFSGRTPRDQHISTWRQLTTYLTECITHHALDAVAANRMRIHFP